MKPQDKTKFEEWYRVQIGTFNFKKELLKKGCEAFVERFYQEAKFNPFEKCSTIASACNLYWRKKHLHNNIAVEPPQGWRGARINQSRAALEWLTYEESQLPSNARIQHARNSGEKAVKTSKGKEHVEGF